MLLPFHNNLVDYGAGSSSNVGNKFGNRRLFILPDGSNVFATREEIYEILGAFVIPKGTKLKAKAKITSRSMPVVHLVEFSAMRGGAFKVKLNADWGLCNNQLYKKAVADMNAQDEELMIVFATLQ